MPSLTFPYYNDGDVLVVLSPSRQYRLHSTTLRLSSDFFRTHLVDTNASHGPSPSKFIDNGAVQFRFELELPWNLCGDENEEERVGKLVLRHLNSTPRANPFTDTSATDISDEDLLYTNYDNALRSLYHIPLDLPSSLSLESLQRHVRGLAAVASALGSIASVSASIDVALLSRGQALIRGIAADPSSWATLGACIRSEVVVREAVCHLTGQWHRAAVRDRAATAGIADGTALHALVEAKAAALATRKTAAEMRLVGFYPDSMIFRAEGGQLPNVGAGSRTTRGEGVPTKVGWHTKNIYDWMAVTLFRHWMGQHVCAAKTGGADDGGAAFYGCIARAGEEYLDLEARESFTRYFPLSSKARTGFDKALGNIKEGVKKYVADIVRTACELDVKTYPVEWLTCTEVAREEMPWYVTDMQDAGLASSTGSTARKDKGKGRKVDGWAEPLCRTDDEIRAPATKSGIESRKRKQLGTPEASEHHYIADPFLTKRRATDPRSIMNARGAYDDPSSSKEAGQPSQNVQGGMHFEIGNRLQEERSEAGTEAIDDEYGEGLGGDDAWEDDDEYGEY